MHNIEGMVLSTVDINNQRILALLNNWKDHLLSDTVKLQQEIRTAYVPNQKSDGDSVLDYYMSDEYREAIVARGDQHCGFPEHQYMMQVRPDQMYLVGEDKAWVDNHINEYTKFNTSMIHELGIRRNALCVAYPPKGFIGWHNNANASAYNLIFTYSETGDGYWQHINPNKDNRIETIQDVPGWQCKASYFGAYQEKDPKTLIYHTAKTNSCWRLTVSYIFDRTHKDWWEQAIEEIESE